MLDISPATASDIDACADLLTVLFTQEADFTPAPDRQRIGLSMILARPEAGRIYCAREDGTVVGMVNLLFTVSTALGLPVGWIEDVVVAPAHRGRGIGDRLLRHVLDEARRIGLARVMLLTDPDNHRAQRFYEGLGFVRSAMVPYRMLLDPATAPVSRP